MPKNVLLVSDGMIHPPLMGRFWLRRIMNDMQDYRYSKIDSLEKLPDLDMTSFHGMVLYFHHKKISMQALNKFDDFVAQGGGVLAIHSATASYKDSDRFTDILGGKFAEHGHVISFDILPDSQVSDIFGEIPAFQLTDEIYIHKLQPDIKTHFKTIYKDRSIPIVWTRIYGNGRICYASPGHRAASMRVPGYQNILSRGLGWVCGSQAL